MEINVGIVEDEKQIRESLMLLINGTSGFRCTVGYDNAEDAIKGIPAASLDVVLMDIHLPGKSGLECIAYLKPKHPEIQFLMCTSFDDAETVFKALKVGATGYLTKTTQPSKILEAIVDIFKGGSPMSSHIARSVVGSFSRANHHNAELQKLTEREQEILGELSNGLRYKEIADKLFVSTETVRTHIRNIYEKLQVNSRTEALNRAFYK